MDLKGFTKKQIAWICLQKFANTSGILHMPAWDGFSAKAGAEFKYQIMQRCKALCDKYPTGFDEGVYYDDRTDVGHTYGYVRSGRKLLGGPIHEYLDALEDLITWAFWTDTEPPEIERKVRLFADLR